jgi:hypothetical protein
MDANNLYGWAMNQPYSPRTSNGWTARSWKSGGTTVVSSKWTWSTYPEELHDKRNEYPLFSEKMKVNKVDKLIPNLNNK